ncbi:MAG TPA: helix-turn-helix domain-containing protein [Candidatus Limosilactobacillus excrementigallinarum]|nr:helix-turn-helix domain-containing protein [Candidatus Limosilactobacillus excrementigallinarum]
MLQYNDFPLDGTIKQDIVCFHHLDKHHTSPFHRHLDHVELLLILNGDVEFFSKKVNVNLKPGDLICIPNGVWHRIYTDSSKKYERVFINIRVSTIARLSTLQTDLMRCFQHFPLGWDVNIVSLTKNEKMEFIALCHRIINYLQSEATLDYGYDLQLDILQARLLLAINSKLQRPKKIPQLVHSSRLQQLLDFIDTHLDQDLSLKELSRRFYLHPDYLNRYFHNHMGLSLHLYIKQLRTDKACRLLTNGERINQVASDCGYQNYSSFIRAFTNEMGISPGKYQRQNVNRS